MKPFNSDEIRCISGIDGFLGEGSYGKVYIGVHEQLGLVAVKCSPMRGGRRERELLEKNIKLQNAQLHEANHEHILKVHGWVNWPGYIGLVMEHCPAGNLKVILVNPDIIIAPILQLRFGAEIATGIAFIHELFQDKHRYHGNVKPENVLLTDNLHCKIADFGASSQWSFAGSTTLTHKRAKQNQYTQMYVAPETDVSDDKRDSFSFGMVMHMILTRQMPMGPDMQIFMYLKGVEQGVRPSLADIDHTKDELKKSRRYDDVTIIQHLEKEMKLCWDQNPSHRPSMSDVRDRLCERLSKYDVTIIEECVNDALRDLDTSEPSRDHDSSVPLHQLFADEQTDEPTACTPATPAPPVPRGRLSALSSPEPPSPVAEEQHAKPKPLPKARRESTTDTIVNESSPSVRTESEHQPKPKTTPRPKTAPRRTLAGAYERNESFPRPIPRRCSSFTQELHRDTEDSTFTSRGQSRDYAIGERQVRTADNGTDENKVQGDPVMNPLPKAPPRRRKTSEIIPRVSFKHAEPDMTKRDQPRYVPLPRTVKTREKYQARNQYKPNKRTTSITGHDANDIAVPESESPTCSDSEKIYETCGTVTERRDEFGSIIDQKTIPRKIHSIKFRIYSNLAGPAIREIRELVAMSTDDFTGNCDQVTDDVINIIGACDAIDFNSRLSLIEWNTGLCGNIPYPHKILGKLRVCAEACRDVAYSMYEDSMTSEIDPKAIPILEEILCRVERVQSCDERLKTEVKSWCLFYIGCCYGYINKHGLTIDVIQRAILAMKGVYRQEACKYRILALCYQSIASTHRLLGNYDKARRSYENEITILLSVEDLSVDAKKQYIDDALKEAESSRELAATHRDYIRQ